MDNEAFSSLVRERANIKSSKEIAREAVEEEFTKRRKRKRNYDGSSDEEGRRSHRTDRKRNEKDKHLKPRAISQSKVEKEEESSKYRDRAKERREGKVNDYEQTERLRQGVVEAALEGDEDVDPEAVSKLLAAGDSEVPMVKGLDVTLARSAKEQRQSTTRSSEPDTVTVPQNTLQAKSWVAKHTQPKSGLGREMLDYLRSQYLPCSTKQEESSSATPAGLAVQRSTLTFALQAHPGNVMRAWEIPREHTYATTDSSYYTRATCLPKDLLDRMETVLNNKPTASGSANNKAHDNTVPQSDENEESEDDIFGNIGDYAPGNEDSDEKDDEHDVRPTVTKGSIFDQLPASAKQPPATAVDNEQIGMAETDDLEQNGIISSGRGSQTMRLTGLSSSRGYGYGDDMDVDFDGRLEDDQEDKGDDKEKKKKKKRKKHNSTE